MKTSKILTTAAIVLIAATTFTSCKKDDKKKPNCKLISATVDGGGGGGGETYTFSYNNDNKVIQIAATGGSSPSTTTLTYSGTTVNIISRSGGSIDGKVILTLNDASHVTRMEDRDPVSNSIDSYTDYTYGTNGNLTSYTSKYGSSAPELTTVATTNGNITSIASAGDITTLEYNTDQAWRSGDYIDIIQRLQQGNNFYLFNQNLLKSTTNGGDISNYNYTYDANNNIATLQIVGGGSATGVTYQHQCD